MMKRNLWSAAVPALLLLVSCGYNLVGRGGQFPAGVERIAVPIFTNETKNTEIARRLTNSFIRELLATGKIKVVAADQAQAEVMGTVTRFEVEPITFDSDRMVLENRVVVSTDVSLVLVGEKEPVFEEKGVTRFHEYAVPDDLSLQQREEDIAYEEVSRELSQKIIALMTEGF